MLYLTRPKLLVTYMYKLDSPLGSLIGLNPCFIRVYNIKSAFHCFSPHYRYIIKQLKKPSKAVYHSANYIVLKPSGHPCRKHSPAARVFYIILVFSNARRVLSQCTFFFVRTLIARARMYLRHSRQRSYAKPIAPRPSSENP